MVDNLVLLSAPGSGTTTKASSVLQKNIKLYGPRNVLTDDTTCWNSEGTNQGGDGDEIHWFLFDFGRPVRISQIKMQLQAGFVAENCRILGFTSNGGGSSTSSSNTWEELDQVNLEDVHDWQTFQLKTDAEGIVATALKLEFEEFTDFYGRITIYQIQIWGVEEK